ncbi:type II secretion system protein [Ruficoccus amylovorans]|uniref:Type II secretion system protein n=1 Tax=Ruficoccus amylovorans TaxID=1804625 RepID=A0A842H9R7_9BACT|nr:type II secretion system protein [Ruficoccus amylovorans]MBC2593035.1 type II secretion system protein [Ruficoccus amylovorans]
MSKRPVSFHPGFTLMEVLVCIIIISVVASLVVAALGQARMLAWRVSCASNLRQIGNAMFTYANDHNGTLPPTTHVTGSEGYEIAWIYALSPYLNDIDEVRICPADPHGPDRLKGGGTSYILNNIAFDPRYDPFGGLMDSYNNLFRLTNPPETFWAGSISDSRTGTSVQNDHTHAEGWDAGWGTFISDIEPNRHRMGDSNRAHTNGSSNYLFADGHVENIPAIEMKRRFDRGENFARPPQ